MQTLKKIYYVAMATFYFALAICTVIVTKEVLESDDQPYYSHYNCK